MHRKLLAALALAVGAALPSGAAAETVARPLDATTVREYRGTVVFEQYEPETEQRRLAIRRAGAAAPELLPIAPSERGFDADIGPDSNGRPQLVYSRCARTCDLFVYSLTGRAGERPVRNANDPRRDDVNPTLWRGRIAWSRRFGDEEIVYTKSLAAPRSRPSTRLPGVPQRRCEDARRERCAPTTERYVEALELSGTNLAQVVGYTCQLCSRPELTELRLVRVSDRRGRWVAVQPIGMSAQSLVGPSFDGGWVHWYRSCLGSDGEACRNGGARPFRHHLRTRAYGQGAPGPIRVHGFAATMTDHYRVEDCSPEAGDRARDALCRIERVPAPEYERISPPMR